MKNSDYVTVTGYYIDRGVGETRKFSSPNPHVDPHCDVGAVTQMDSGYKEENINGTEQVNGMGQWKGPRVSQQLRDY